MCEKYVKDVGSYKNINYVIYKLYFIKSTVDKEFIILPNTQFLGIFYI